MILAARIGPVVDWSDRVDTDYEILDSRMVVYREVRTHFDLLMKGSGAEMVLIAAPIVLHQIFSDN